MSTHMRAFLASGLGELRYEPTGKRIRAVLGDQTAVDSTRAALVWEPRRIVPSYAVPADDVLGELSPAGAAVAGRPGEAGVVMPGLSRRPVLDPSVPGAGVLLIGHPRRPGHSRHRLGLPATAA